MSDPTKTKKPKRSQSEMAAVHQERAEKARRKSIEGTDLYKALDEAACALRSLAIVPFTDDEEAKVLAAARIVDAHMQSALLGPNPWQGVSGTAP